MGRLAWSHFTRKDHAPLGHRTEREGEREREREREREKRERDQPTPRWSYHPKTRRGGTLKFHWTFHICVGSQSFQATQMHLARVQPVESAKCDSQLNDACLQNSHLSTGTLCARRIFTNMRCSLLLSALYAQTPSAPESRAVSSFVKYLRKSFPPRLFNNRRGNEKGMFFIFLSLPALLPKQLPVTSV